ncbi:MAG: glycosyltransferase family 4 protein [Planctomycetes bacterium]|nr:glycosyltransferase family 4 protein [Planctomycetota bacterium]
MLFVGAINPRKDVRFLVERLNVLRDELPSARLFLVGPVLNDEYGEDLDRRIAELGLEERVVRVGFVEDPTEYYALADALVFASRLEGFGNVLLEAMAHELPLLVRRLPGVTDSFVEHGRTGLLFEGEADYDAQLLRLAREPELRAALGRAARAEVVARFSLETVADRYVALYHGRPDA